MRHISRFLEGVCVWDVGRMNWENVAGGKDEPLHTARSLFAACPRCPNTRQTPCGGERGGGRGGGYWDHRAPR